MSDANSDHGNPRWGRFRTGVIGHLLSAPPMKGELQAALADLANHFWTHPITGEPTQFAQSTIERWYYAAREAQDPVRTLARRSREDAGSFRAISQQLRSRLLAQHGAHRGWSYKLHADNLAAIADQDSSLGPAPSYATVRRFMKANGLEKRRRPKRDTPGARLAAARLDAREVRSFESEFVHGLWHWDFHIGSLRVLLPSGHWHYPHVFASLDDRSRVCGHMQWYLTESAETLFHGLSQALMKRGLPRESLSDGGKAMIATETINGLTDLGIVPHTTLPHSPYQNGKQEAFWGPVEGRLLAMLEGVETLTLDLLNEATQAWVELEYNRAIHSEIGTTPIDRMLAGPDVGRLCPSPDRLRELFTRKEWRTQRKSDGTISVDGVRFEIPSRFRHFERVRIRYAKWDLSHVLLIDDQTERSLARVLPLDKAGNADGRRRKLDCTTASSAEEPATKPGIAPLLAKLMHEHRETGLPPGYLPKTENETSIGTEAVPHDEGDQP